MFLRELTAPAGTIRGAGKKTAALLAEAGIPTVAALLTRYPRDWEDRGRSAPLRDWAKGPVSTTVTVLAQDWFGSGPARTLKVYVEDETARAALVCFNRPFFQYELTPGKRCRLWGKFRYGYGELRSSAFEIEAAGGEGPGIVPVYPLSAGLSQVPSRGQNLLRRLVRAALDQYAGALDDEIPPAVIASRHLLPKAAALRAIHFPSTMEELAQARQSLIFEELFYLEVIIGRRAMERRGTGGGPNPAPVGALGEKSPPPLSPLQRRLLDRLPFALTPGQVAAINEINADMDRGGGDREFEGTYAMARLLQGDVGSGKTLAAFFAALRAVDGPGETGQAGQDNPSGQAAIMAPTELLARQHAENAARLLEPLGVRIACLTGGLAGRGSPRARLLEALAAGEVDIVLGTHALFSRDVTYRNLRLVVVDEQHRFGVTQRQAILAKGPGSPPHLLMMSATPIPRTLALTVFGDLDISVIPDLPPGRKPVKTHLVRESNAGRVYDFVGKELEAGRQAYFVYPLIGDDDGGGEGEGRAGDGLKSAQAMAEKLRTEIFPRFPAALVHSRLEDEEKRRVMERFRSGEIRVLAATSVVEVGVDVPGASCMVVHHAERFGLSALHQLRGRVGRSGERGYCFLIYSEREVPPAPPEADPGSPGGEGRSREGRRLMVILENTDGFVIAEEDLKLRGPGRIAGVEQSGYFKLGVADPVRDADILLAAREEAFAALEADPGLLSPENRRVAEVLERAPPFSEVGM
ncbi:MAG: ATP-dependent DNA helicase RecG [Treponema sp.]|jgi:ATP-dependent DNA helicase RecG|nr:ATP-dependent DNA helicase RecG [Treponema sp.]